MSSASRRAGWRPWSGNAAPEIPASLPVAAPPAQIEQAVKETIAARTLNNHLTQAIEDFAPTPQPQSASQEGPTMTTPTSPGSHALTIKQMLEGHAEKLDQILQAQAAALQATLEDQVTTVVSGTEAVIGKVKGHTDDFKAILGQFTNEL